MNNTLSSLSALSEQASLEHQLLQTADLCVKCGLCLPHCPTYGLHQNEGDSPRGRIGLMQGIVSGKLDISPNMLQHFDGCLGCRACEAVCPSNVPYGQLFDDLNYYLEQSTGSALYKRWLRWLSISVIPAQSGRSRILMSLLKWLTQAGILRRLPSRQLTRMAAYLQDIRLDHPWKKPLSRPSATRGRVALFLGCVARTLDAGALADAVTILHAAGYQVDIPEGQGCCGAISYHSGDYPQGQQLLQQNLAAIDPSRYDAIISIASGCGTMLRDYPQKVETFAGQEEQARSFSSRVQDINAFLLDNRCLDSLRFRESTRSVAYHVPCSMRNVWRRGEVVAGVLASIPGLQAIELPAAQQCCGAGGIQMMTQTETADSLAAAKLDGIEEQAIDYLVTANTGCALHLGAQLKQRHASIPVVQPVTLLARHLIQE